MRIFKNKPFSQWAGKMQITDELLVFAVNEMVNGLYEANLGGHIYKKRLPLGHKGKSGGVRTIVAFKVKDKAIFIYGFSKNSKTNITQKEEESLKDLAKIYFGLDENQINKAIKVGVLIEVYANEKSILKVVHESAKGLYDIGLMDAKTMHSFDVKCLSPVKKLSPKQIKQIRLREKVSQGVFAEYLNASHSTVKKWETGEKHPTGPALKLLNLVSEKGLEILA